MFSQIISLDISQRSIFVPPALLSANLFQFDGHFLALHHNMYLTSNTVS
ncbi:hypothetical protein BRO54_3431 [Geobacillus proteiniphilus]|uniref:Uncharacterized protein n=1 Tax=Geobacillus proteiniphilus TaxID=860353 RepID=A0A1Q5SM22_9BACL|nr:hypothetical protein BRO54_3431 [Geobacillus proteiniphilus]